MNHVIVVKMTSCDIIVEFGLKRISFPYATEQEFGRHQVIVRPVWSKNSSEAHPPIHAAS